MIVSKSDGLILELNAAAEEAFGYSRQELLGQKFDLLIPHSPKGDYADLRDGGPPVALRKDGTGFPVEVSVSSVPADKGSLFYATIRDISEHLLALRLTQRLKFEHTVAGLSTRFINVPPDCVDGEVTAGLEILVNALDTDRANLGRFDPTTGDLVVTHSWTRPGIAPFGERLVKGVLPWLEATLRRGEVAAIETPEELPPEAIQERQYGKLTGIKSTLAVPFCVAGKVVGAVSTGAFREHKRWDDFLISRVKDIADIFANALTRKWADEALQKAISQIRELKDRYERENVYLQEEIKLDHSHAEVIGDSPAIRYALKKAEQVAGMDTAVLLFGETGTGKELIARTIHELSHRKGHAMVKVNCAALPATLIESELFGREKGAYTGALAREIGRFELADGSTLFLDEIGDLPIELQPKLLRVLQEGQFERLGSSKTLRVNVRVIAATNRNLATMMAEGKFRADLYYRLSVFPISVPPLRDRLDDIPALTWHILNDLGSRMGRQIRGIHPATIDSFCRYSWPGNVRELRNLVERNLIVNADPIFRAEVGGVEEHIEPQVRRLDKVEFNHVRSVLETTRWRVRGKGGAADILGLKPTTLEARMKKMGLSRHV